MRIRLIASLVGLSLASGHEAIAQQAASLAPSRPPLSYAERFGGLLSQPPGMTSTASPATGSAATTQTAQATLPLTRQSAGGRLEIPWSRTVTQSPSDVAAAQAANLASAAEPSTAGAAPTASTAAASGPLGLGAQVGALTAQVQPNYVAPLKAAGPLSPLATPAATTPHPTLPAVPWQAPSPAAPSMIADHQAAGRLEQAQMEKKRLEQARLETERLAAARQTAERQVAEQQTAERRKAQHLKAQQRASAQRETDRLAAERVAAERLATAQRERKTPEQAQPQVAQLGLRPPATPTGASDSRTAIASSTTMASSTSSSSRSRAEESLIAPVPTSKLPVATSAPEKAAPTAAAPAPSAMQLPQYVLVDTQTSASDLPPGAQVRMPSVSHRLTDDSPAPAASSPSAPPADALRLAQQPLPPSPAAPLPAPPAAQPPAVQPPAAIPLPSPQVAAVETPLLSTEAMIGPLQNAEQLFDRLDLEYDLRDVAARMETGPRGDAGNYAWMPAAYTWISPALYHHPLYFEQPNLERYGVGTHRALQPLASSIHFFGSIPLAPYKTLTHHPREKVYSLGHLRPGNCVPVQRGVILGPSSVGEVSMFWEPCSGY